MIKLLKRILDSSGIYKKRITIAFVFSFLKSVLMKAPIGFAFIAINAKPIGAFIRTDFKKEKTNAMVILFL